VTAQDPIPRSAKPVALRQ